jgi:hypothetical protein
VQTRPAEQVPAHAYDSIARYIQTDVALELRVRALLVLLFGGLVTARFLVVVIITSVTVIIIHRFLN